MSRVGTLALAALVAALALGAARAEPNGCVDLPTGLRDPYAAPPRPIQLYRAGHEALRRGHLGEAARLFERFLELAPHHRARLDAEELLAAIHTLVVPPHEPRRRPPRASQTTSNPRRTRWAHAPARSRRRS